MSRTQVLDEKQSAARLAVHAALDMPCDDHIAQRPQASLGKSAAGSLVCPTMVGRTVEVERLKQLIDDATDGGGTTVLVAGEAGIGKSRLVAAARSYAASRGFLVFTGASFPQDHAAPYAPLLDLLRTRFAGRPADVVAASVGPFAREMGMLLPELRLPAAAPAPSAFDQAVERQRLFAAFTHCLTASAHDQPVLLIIEDLHWCDDATLDVLFGLARMASTLPLLVVTTHRHDEIDARLRTWLTQLNRERLATELLLAPLSCEDVAAMVQAITLTPQPVPAEVVNDLYGLADGNPFYVEELLKTSREPAHTVDSWRRALKGSASLALPDSLQMSVLQRVEQLSPAAVAVLRLAAVIGRRFEFEVIERLADVDERTLLSLLRELVEAQLVVEESRDRFAFRHALTREAVYAGLLGRERGALHRQVAELCEQVDSVGKEQQLSDLANHFYAAAMWEQALRYARQAGERARRLYAPRAAVTQFSQALDAARHLSAPADEAAAQQCARLVASLHRERGRSYETIGDFERSLDDCEAALALARSAGDRHMEWRILLDLGRLWGGRDYREAGRRYEAALALARGLDDASTLAQTLNCVGEWQVNTEHDPWSARPLHEEALSLFEQLGDRHGVAMTLQYLGIVHYQGSDLPGAIPFCRRAADLFRELGQQRGVVSALTMLATRAGATDVNPITVATADFEGGVRDGEEAIRIAREIGWRPGEALALFMLAVVLAEQGHYARALDLGRRSRTLAEEMGHHHWLAGANCTLGTLHTELLALPTATQHLLCSEALARSVGSTVWQQLATTVLGRAYLYAGDLDRAAEVLGPTPDPGLPIRAMCRRMLAHVHAQLAIARGGADLALRLLDRLAEPPADGIAPYVNPHLELTRAEALVALGRTDEAEAVLRLVRDTAWRARCKPLLWRAQAALGTRYHARRQHDAARREFAAASSVIEELAAELPDEPLRTTFLENATSLLPRSYRHSLGRVAAVQSEDPPSREREDNALVSRRSCNCDMSATLEHNESSVQLHISKTTKLAVDPCEQGTTEVDVERQTLRLLIVDALAIVRQGLVRLLDGCLSIEVVGEAASGNEALTLAAALRPDVVLLDLSLPDTDGVEIARRLRAADHPPHVVVFTGEGGHDRVTDAIEAGVIGYLLKDVDRLDLVRAIEDAAAGRPALHADVQRYLMRQSSAPTAPSPLASLTERERELMRCLAQGYSNRQIAAELGLTHGTVKVYISALLAKLGVTDRTQAALLAARLAERER
jgi:DNA-binding NarL/FixJ family response regulator/tetratricopeptide (TPR) repeat protein